MDVVCFYLCFIFNGLNLGSMRQNGNEKNLEMCLSLEFKFTIGIKRTIYSPNSQKQFYK